MILRSLPVALIVLALAAPAAEAGLGDELLPSRGVSVGQSAKSGVFMRFGPKAARLYRSIAGKRAVIACAKLKNDGTLDDFAARRATLPRKRGRVRVGGRLRSADFCTLGVKPGDLELELCARNGRDAKECVRAVAARTDAGRMYLDGVARSAELLLTEFYLDLSEGWDEIDLTRSPFKRYLTALAGPDASPPAGKVGYWTQGDDTVVVTLLADGSRRFISRRGGVLSTNDPALMGINPASLSVFG